MKVKLLTTISFFTYQLSISQTEKLLHGKVVSQNNIIKGADVINKTAKTSTTTNDLGAFSISANVKDSLFFISNDYFISKLKVTSQNIETSDLVINMILKPEELNEVVVSNIKFKPIQLTANEIEEIKLSSGRPTGFGTIQNGMDFVYIGKKLYALLSKEKQIKPKSPEIDFKKLIGISVPLDFFTKELNLKPEEKELFLEFCDADPRSKTLLDHSNILTTMDFLYAKNDEFKKLKTKNSN
ncbi:hypothetical protein [Flavobacterium sp. LC2016-12]|uniref:hypothetical protein n=1 Tax=Flavobacterium sp. LC2016-12 TaxID=2783794 RepID=UPI00188CDA05|nr:hypothetical protein [Flavobacterium sp. LC2016-12]MBF4466749.1 hypothetical protein [Flavobacterium sp. LC2016-12]